MDDYSYHLVTYGCQKNEYDSEVIAALLGEMGYRRAASAEEAALIVLNTCCIRDNADQKVYGRINQYKAFKDLNAGVMLAVTGCLAQKDNRMLLRRFSNVDIVLGTQNLDELPAAVEQVRLTRRPYISCTLSSDFKDLPVSRSTPFFAWVPISEGCDCRCTFCIVPSVRGSLKSRPLESIVREVRQFADQGGREVTLLGQNVNAYGNDKNAPDSFAALLTAVNDIDGLKRIRFMSPHPANFSLDLIKTLGGLHKVCEHIHLPLQSGDDRVLKRMGRRYTVSRYRQIVEGLRASIPSLALTTDIIVGFPGESEEEFLRTIGLLEELQFDGAFMFAYSEREGTAAARMKDAVPPEERLARLHILIEKQNAVTLSRNEQEAGRVEEVLVECVSRKNALMLRGKTRRNKLVHFEGKADLIGETVQVRLIRAYTWGFLGEALS